MHSFLIQNTSNSIQLIGLYNNQMRVGQIQTRGSKKYSYFDTNPLNKFYREQPEETYQRHTTKSVEKLGPSTEATLEDISQDLIKELTIKNKLLSAQLGQYKTLVKNLEGRISELTLENKQLIEKNSQANISKTVFIDNQAELKSLNQTIPQYGKRSSKKMLEEHMFSLEQIDAFLDSCNIHRTSIKEGKTEREERLDALVGGYKEMEAFVDSIWKMKDKVEEGGEDRLDELWEWLKKLGWNYYYLLREKKERLRSLSSSKHRSGKSRK